MSLPISPDSGFILCLDVPPGTEIGLDLHCWTVGADFKGFYGVPAGPHVLYFAPAAGAPRQALLLALAPSSTRVLLWNKALETFELAERARDEAFVEYATAAARAGAFLSNLGPYQLDTEGQWRSLSSAMDGSVMERIQPVGGVIASSRLVAAGGAGRQIAGGSAALASSSDEERSSREGIRGHSLTAAAVAGAADAREAAESQSSQAGPSLSPLSLGSRGAVSLADHDAAIGVLAPPGQLAESGSGAGAAAALDAADRTQGSTPALQGSTPSYASAQDKLLKEQARALELQILSPSTAADSLGLFFTPIRGAQSSSSPADKTDFALDSSKALAAALQSIVKACSGLKLNQRAGQLLHQQQQQQSAEGRGTPSPLPLPVPPAWSWQQLLGELQSAYLLATLCEVLPALEQWKHVVSMLLRCEDALEQCLVAGAASGGGGGGRPPAAPASATPLHLFTAPAYCEMLRVLTAQVRHLPADLLEEAGEMREKTQEGGVPAAAGGAAAGAAAIAPDRESRDSSGKAKRSKFFLSKPLEKLAASARRLRAKADIGGSPALQDICKAAELLLDVVRGKFGEESVQTTGFGAVATAEASGAALGGSSSAAESIVAVAAAASSLPAAAAAQRTAAVAPPLAMAGSAQRSWDQSSDRRDSNAPAGSGKGCKTMAELLAQLAAEGGGDGEEEDLPMIVSEEELAALHG